MKKILSLALVLLTVATLFGCSKAVIYEEETTIHTWLKQRTEGYVQLTPSSLMVLTNREDGYRIELSTGSDMIPELTVKNQKNNTTATEKNLLTVTTDQTLFAQANHKNSVFDPYRNSYTRALQVWKKDESTLRIFLWLHGEYTDFYPIPKLLTQSQYSEMLKLVEDYDAKRAEASKNSGEKIINYTGDFLNLYKSSYFSDKAKNPDGDIYYECVATTEYAAEYRKLFAQLGLSEQDWRKSFEKLGYTGQRLNLQIVYFDLTIGKNGLKITLNTADAFTSALLKSKNLPLEYAFCPNLQAVDGIHVEIK